MGNGDVIEVRLEGTLKEAVEAKLNMMRQIDEAYARERQRLANELLGTIDVILRLNGYDPAKERFAVEDVTAEKIVCRRLPPESGGNGR